MARVAITRTAPGWEERTTTLLSSAARGIDGVGETVNLRPGFARLALLLDAQGAGTGAGLRIWVQHSWDGTRWADLAAFDLVNATFAQVAWVEAQPEIDGSVVQRMDGQMAEGEVHSGFVMSKLRVRWTCGGATHVFGVDVVAIYERR